MANFRINSISLVMKKIEKRLRARWKRMGDADLMKWENVKKCQKLGARGEISIFRHLGQNYLIYNNLSYKHGARFVEGSLELY